MQEVENHLLLLVAVEVINQEGEVKFEEEER